MTEAGAATVGGVKAPCAPIVKVAGRRTFVGGLGVVAVEGPVEVSVRADWRARVRFFRAGFGFLSVEAMAAGVEAVVRVEDVAGVLLEDVAPPPQPARANPASRAASASRLKVVRATSITSKGDRACQMSSAGAYSAKVVEYDVFRRRLWICGQRCHHGATGLLVTFIACLGLITDAPDAAGHGRRTQSMIALAAGGALMLHDWKDRGIWFERGPGSQA